MNKTLEVVTSDDTIAPGEINVIAHQVRLLFCTGYKNRAAETVCGSPREQSVEAAPFLKPPQVVKHKPRGGFPVRIHEVTSI